MIASKTKNEPAKIEEENKPRPKGRTRSLASLIFLEAAVAAFSGSTAAFITLFAADHYGITAAAAAIFMVPAANAASIRASRSSRDRI